MESRPVGRCPGTTLPVLGVLATSVGLVARRRRMVRGRGAGSFGALEGHGYVNLTTFRGSGEAVPETVWFALAGGRIYATIAPDPGEMKRIRNDSRVLPTPSNA